MYGWVALWCVCVPCGVLYLLWACIVGLCLGLEFGEHIYIVRWLWYLVGDRGGNLAIVLE